MLVSSWERMRGRATTTAVQHRGEKLERADPQNPHQNLNHHWYEAITGGMTLRWYIVVVGYGTIVILLGWYPWTFF